jgi:hypothetical protein
MRNMDARDMKFSAPRLLQGLRERASGRRRYSRRAPCHEAQLILLHYLIQPFFGFKNDS